MPIKNLAKNGPVGVLKPRCTIAVAHIRALTTAPRIKPTSIFLRSARRPNPGRGSTYRCGIFVQTTGTSSAFGRQAARLDHSVLYLRVPRLFEDLALARLDGRFPRFIDKLARVQLLLLDGWGTHTLNDQQRRDLLEIFESKRQSASTM